MECFKVIEKPVIRKAAGELTIVMSINQIMQRKKKMKEIGLKPSNRVEIKKTTCTICMSNCALDAHVQNGKLAKVSGTSENPATRGSICIKGAVNKQYIYHEDRIRTHLLKRGARIRPNLNRSPGTRHWISLLGDCRRSKKPQAPSLLSFFQDIPNDYGHFAGYCSFCLWSKKRYRIGWVFRCHQWKLRSFNHQFGYVCNNNRNDSRYRLWRLCNRRRWRKNTESSIVSNFGWGLDQ